MKKEVFRAKCTIKPKIKIKDLMLILTQLDCFGATYVEIKIHPVEDGTPYIDFRGFSKEKEK